jgi:hypothetical protein
MPAVTYSLPAKTIKTINAFARAAGCTPADVIVAAIADLLTKAERPEIPPISLVPRTSTKK